MKSTITVSREIPVIKIALITGGKLRSRERTPSPITCTLRHGFDRVAFGTALKRRFHTHTVSVDYRREPKPESAYQSIRWSVNARNRSATCGLTRRAANKRHD
jgi:hypothetical protein